VGPRFARSLGAPQVSGSVDADSLEAALRAFFTNAPTCIVAVYLYGSRARGDARRDSDVDVALLYAVTPPRTFESLPLDIEGELERRLGLPVQAIVLNHAPPDLVHRVFRDGRLILDRDRAQRIRFEVKLRSEFLDLQPVLARYRAVRPPAR
jgi:predicted nucleotidyltransferase